MLRQRRRLVAVLKYAILALVALALVSGTLLQVRAGEESSTATTTTTRTTTPPSPRWIDSSTIRSSSSSSSGGSGSAILSSDKKNIEKEESNFCKGTPMTMFMEGFHWSLLWRSSSSNNYRQQQQQQQHQREPPPCLTYLIDSWVLNETHKFHLAIVVTFLLAVLTEGLSAVRGVIVRGRYPKRKRQCYLLLVYSLQALMGYVIMFVAMMFSVELLLAVAVGLACGNALFVRFDDDNEDAQQDEASTTAPTTMMRRQQESSQHQELAAQSSNNDTLEDESPRTENPHLHSL